MSNNTGPSETRTGGPILQFFIKTVIVAVALTISLIILINSLANVLDEFVDRRVAQLHAVFVGENLGKHSFWTHVERQLDRAADARNDIPPERQQKLLNDIRILADRARPFIREAERAFFDPSHESAATEK
jgi:hypothetical protein